MVTDGAAPSRAQLVVVGVAFTATGAAALLAQVTWQRVIALHAGMDLESSTTVVAAFLGGLGVGNLLGGRLADRLDRRRALVALAVASIGIAAYALVSTRLLYDLYRDLASSLDSLPLRMGFNAVLLLVPTVLGGLGLPLIARVVTTDVATSGSRVGRLNAANTCGAALGALAGTWYLLGMYGFEGALRIVAGFEVMAAVLYLGVASTPVGPRSERQRAVGTVITVVAVVAAERVIGSFLGSAVHLGRFQTMGRLVGAVLAGALAYVAFVAERRPGGVAERDAAPAPDVPEVEVEAEAEAGAAGANPPAVGAPASAAPWPVWVWYLIYGSTGAVALGVELAMFRLVSGVMRSNTYTFGHVLGLYLAMLAIGGALGSWLRPRVADHRRAFLWLQCSVGISLAASVLVFLHVLPRTALGPRMEAWFATDGFAAGFGDTWSQMFLFAVVLPLLLLGPAVVAIGAAFPFAQGLVTDDLAHVGDRTGRLVAANIAGNVAGTLLTTFVLIHNLGTAGALRVLIVLLLVAGVAAVAIGPRSRRIPGGAAFGVVAIVLLVALPSNHELWGSLAPADTAELTLAEDRSCASALEQGPSGRSYRLTINVTSQNGYPFDDFHVLIGLLPSLVHPNPQDALAVGYGIGSTSYGMLASERTGTVRTVELCGGNYRLVEDLARRGVPEMERLVDDPAHIQMVDDGRRYLLVHDDRHDLIVPDTLRPNAPGAGNLYSREFQELVRSRLAPGGITAGWFPSLRALNAVTSTFPYVAGLQVEAYGGSPFYLASEQPLDLDRDDLLARFDALPDDALPDFQRESIREAIEGAELVCYTNGEVATVDDPFLENRDLFPRDEYSLANGAIGEGGIARTCGAS